MIQQVLQDNKKIMADLNRSQLSKGERTDGSKIGSYEESTIRYRRRKGKQTSFVDLKVSGDLYKQIDLFTTKSITTFFSRVSYAVYQEDRYVDSPQRHIFGLTDENIKKLAEQKLQPELKRRVKKHMFNGV